MTDGNMTRRSGRALQRSDNRVHTRAHARYGGRQALRVALWSVFSLLILAAAVGGWALNRYVIDHVEISDVNSYESSVSGESTDGPLATFPAFGVTLATDTKPVTGVVAGTGSRDIALPNASPGGPSTTGVTP
jgi:hypothetical protein